MDTACSSFTEEQLRVVNPRRGKENARIPFCMNLSGKTKDHVILIVVEIENNYCNENKVIRYFFLKTYQECKYKLLHEEFHPCCSLRAQIQPLGSHYFEI